MRVFIAGVDGYLGWALAQYLAARGHEVAGADTYFRRDWVAEMGSQSAMPIARMTQRLDAFREHYDVPLDFRRGDLLDEDLVEPVVAGEFGVERGDEHVALPAQHRAAALGGEHLDPAHRQRLVEEQLQADQLHGQAR